MIKYPKLIKTATEKLANVREDVKARDKRTSRIIKEECHERAGK